ncbi:unnamed protein product [Rotaria magnacalcarata]|uniref:Uncharacterized protein n=1 Tax=Rotaria magnacalcarata TaxID=392030 RepID=A0A814PG16_9BILA|nr:unnamed protein product [Rotaria magnacalcarata]CAF1588178.1 unnamed protein product [Rotaria magnacalcarata]CAF2088134.1 unnamed protein product [Rotaria magnacalcarata]CAF2102782.1 unnamed protein product [Rotaria magnacalcarata]CAF2121336.1 unnamed protein product [Rotaria magnacalcarata]
MSDIPEGHKSTSIHHVSVIKGSTEGAYRCEILGREFMFSDQIETVISGLYGHDMAEHAHFYVDHKRVNRNSLLDDHQGKDIHVYYADHIHDSSRLGSFSVPVLEHHQTLRHHETGVIH